MTNAEILDRVLTALIALSAVGAFVLSLINRVKLKELHVSINSRLSELIVAAGALGRAEGMAQEKEKQSILSNKNEQKS